MNPLRELDQDDRVMSGAIMTTFPFDPQFFEQAVLPALRDKKLGDRIAVLVDADRYSSIHAAAEQGDTLDAYTPAHLGQRYHLSPVSAGPNRTFHPKIHVITGERRVQLTVGSANLTHPGLTSNQEIVTRLEIPATADDDPALSDEEQFTRGEKAAIFGEVSEFLTTLCESSLGHSIDRVTSTSITQTLEAGSWVDEIEHPSDRDRQSRFVHSLERPILAQVRERIASRGESVEQVDIVAPFFGTSLRVPQAFTAEGVKTRLWLQNGRAQIDVEKLDAWLKESCSSAYSLETNRYLHGKLLIIRTGEAAYCLSGSQNASYAALLVSTGDGGGNVEAAVLRRMADSTHFEYLLQSHPFTDADALDVDSFEAVEGLGLFGADGESGAAPESDSIQLHDISYRRSGSYDGGRLTVRGNISADDRDVVRAEGATLVVSRGGTVSTVKLRPHHFEWESTPAGVVFEYVTDIYGEQAQKPFIRTGTATLHVGPKESNTRWVQTQSPTGGGPITEDVADAGAKAVPNTIFGLFSADAEERMQILDSLNALLTALRDHDGEPTDRDGQQPHRTSPRGGLRVRPWSQSTASDPADLLAKYFAGWKVDLEECVRAVSADHFYTDDVGARLEGINNTAVQILVLKEARSELTVPTQPALTAIDDVYKKLERGERYSLVANFCYNIRPIANRSDEHANAVYSALHQDVLPHVMFAAIVSEAHIAGDRATYFRQQHWAFEGLIGDCFPSGYPKPAHLTDSFVDDLVLTIQELTAVVRSQFEESRRYRRYADSRYMDEKQLRSAVIEFLARSILYAGPEAINAYRSNPQFESQVERVFEAFVEFLPRTNRRQVERLL